MAVHTPNPNPNPFVRFMRRIYHPLGFKKGYNFVLFFIFAGAMLGFVLARASYMNVQHVFRTKAAPGEWLYYSQRFYNIGISLHLICVIPAGLLAILQFVPIIRYKALIFHRVNGHAAILLLILAVVGALMITRHAFGGALETQTAMGVLSIATLVSVFLAYYNIKRLQIDQHRAWMLRGWFYAGSIITIRLIQAPAAVIIGIIGTFNHVVPCQQIAFVNRRITGYPACAADPNGLAVVHADLSSPKSAIEVAAALQLTFGMAAWLALTLHALGVEIYLRLTPAETERLKNVSYERQLERGMKHPGSAGLTVDRLGDAEDWKPSVAAETTGNDVYQKK